MEFNDVTKVLGSVLSAISNLGEKATESKDEKSSSQNATHLNAKDKQEVTQNSNHAIAKGRHIVIQQGEININANGDQNE